MTALVQPRKLPEKGSGARQQIKHCSHRTDTMEGGPLALRPDKPLPPDPPSTATSLPMSDMQTPSEKSRSSSRQSVGSSSFAPSEEEKSDTKAPAQLHESSRIREAYSNPSTNTLHTDTFPSPETEKVEYLNEKDFRNIDRYVLLRRLWLTKGTAFCVFRHRIVIRQK